MHCGTESIFERSPLLSNEIDKAVNAKWNQNMLSFKFKMAEHIFGNIADWRLFYTLKLGTLGQVQKIMVYDLLL